MDKIESDLRSAWKEGQCHEYDISYIRDLLIENKKYVKIFIDIFEAQEHKRDSAFAIILEVIPYDGAVKYAQEFENWKQSDFESYYWFDGQLDLVTRDDVCDWLNSRQD
ncbi:MAG: hypothetical protein P8179_21400 [Candidatus Thiodiazotropha sp.]|jgi:hypothetical protein